MKLSKLIIVSAALGLVVSCSGGDKKAPADKAPEAKSDVAKPAVDATPAEPAGAPGNIKVTVKFEGKAPARTKLDRSADPYCAKTSALSEDVIVNSDGTLANTAVYIQKVSGKFKAPAESIKLTQNGCTYIPHVQTAMKGQSVDITNGDTTLHNVHSYKGAKKKNWFNVAQPPGAPAKVEKLKKAELATFKCDVHPWMSSYVLAVNNSYHGVTGDTGVVRLKEVPSKGKAYTVVTWHEKFGEQEAKAVVKPGEEVEVTITYKAAELHKGG